MNAKRKKKPKRPFSKAFSWQEHTKPIVLITVIVAVFSAFLVVVYDPMRPGDRVFGVLQSEYRQNLNQYVSTRYVVKLDSGQLVDVQANRLGTFQKGKRVILQEMSGMIFRRKEYRFLQYADR